MICLFFTAGDKDFGKIYEYTKPLDSPLVPSTVEVPLILVIGLPQKFPKQKAFLLFKKGLFKVDSSRNLG